MSNRSPLLNHIVKPDTLLCDFFLTQLSKNSRCIDNETVLNHFTKLDWITILQAEEGYKSLKILLDNYDHLSKGEIFNNFFYKLLNIINTSKPIDTWDPGQQAYFSDKRIDPEKENVEILYSDDLIRVLDSFKERNPDYFKRYSNKEYIPIDFYHICKFTVLLDSDFILRHYEEINWDSGLIIAKIASDQKLHGFIPKFIGYYRASNFLLNDETIFFNENEYYDNRYIREKQSGSLGDYYVFPSERVLQFLTRTESNKIKLSGLYSSPSSTLELLKTYKDVLDWDNISANSNIEWSLDFIKEHIDKIDWRQFCRHSSFFKNHKNIESLQPHINWENLSRNENAGIDLKLINKYYTFWDQIGLCENKSISFDINFLESHTDFIITPEIFTNPNNKHCIKFIDLAIQLHKNEPDYSKLTVSSYYLYENKFFKSNLWSWLELYSACWNNEIFLTFADYWHLPKLLNNPYFFEAIIVPMLNSNSLTDILKDHWDNNLVDESSINTSWHSLFTDNELLIMIKDTGNYCEEDILTEGKYKNLNIQKIIEIDLEYLLKLIVDDKFFCISLSLFNEIGDKYIYRLKTPISTVKLYEKAKQSKIRLELNYDIEEKRAIQAQENEDNRMRWNEEQREYNEQAEQGFNEAYEIDSPEESDDY